RAAARPGAPAARVPVPPPLPRAGRRALRHRGAAAPPGPRRPRAGTAPGGDLLRPAPGGPPVTAPARTPADAPPAPGEVLLRAEGLAVHFPQRGGPPVRAVDGVDLEVRRGRSEEHTSELQSRENLVCRLLLEKKKVENNTCYDQHRQHTLYQED